MIIKDLRTHQADALAAIKTANIGRIVIPTGGGKTAVQAFTIRDTINENKHKVHLVLAPRIALVNQLIVEYRNMIGQKYLAVAFHSGRHEPDYTKVKWSEKATTSPQVIAEEMVRANRMKKDLVIFSTYASFEKLLPINFETVIADESQYCVAEGHFEVIRALNADRKYFFTATERHTPDSNGRGLNNEDVFGPVLYQVAPKTLIEKGYIVAPRLHVCEAKTKDNAYTVINEVIEVAKKQIELSSNLPINKVLFAMKGTADVEEVLENISEIKANFPNNKIFTITSKRGCNVDGQQMPRGNFMKELRDCDKALIFHYDILSEGIDVDGITGVVIMRNMNHSKLLQTIGRAVRVYKADPSAKQYAWVSVLSLNDNNETSSHLQRVVKAIRDGGFEVNVEEVEFTNADGFGIADNEDIDSVIDLDGKSKVKSILENVLHSIEEVEFKQAIYCSTLEQTLEDF